MTFEERQKEFASEVNSLSEGLLERCQELSPAIAIAVLIQTTVWMAGKHEKYRLVIDKMRQSADILEKGMQ